MNAAPLRSTAPGPWCAAAPAGPMKILFRTALAAVCAICVTAGAAGAQCPEAAPLANYTGSPQGICPCFVAGEQAGVVLTAPSGDYPLEVLRVGIAWASQFGGAPQSLEQAINVYAGGLPDPGTPIFTLPGPVLTDGVINEFDLEPYPGAIVVNSGPFTVSLEFLNDNSGDIFAPSVTYDSGCQAGRNVVYAQPGGWTDACQLGVGGDWVFYAIYRPCAPNVGVDDGLRIAASRPVFLTPPRPNPFRSGTGMDFVLAREGPASVSVYDVSGRRLALLADGFYTAGAHHLTWDGRTTGGARVPSGAYFVVLRSGGHNARRTVLLTE